MKKKTLLTPGPTPVPERALTRMAMPAMHHRHSEFKKVLGEVREGLKYIFQTKSEVIIFASSGTGAMEAAVTNTLCKGDQVLVAQAGKFGERWAQICAAYGVNADVITVEWGKAVDVKTVEAKLKEKKYKAFFIQATETSTGVKHPIKPFADMLKNTDTLFVVDGVTGVGVFPLPFDEWGIDILVTGSQKALMLPPGLAFAALSEKAWKACDKSDLPKYYFNFKKELKNLGKDETAYTPAVSLLVGLAEVIKMYKEETLEKVFAENAKMAEATRAALTVLGLKLFAPDAPSEACTAAWTPAGIDGAEIVKKIRDVYGYAIAGGQDQVKGKIIRIAHMGYINRWDIVAGIAALEQTLSDLGYKFEIGSGVKAAMQVFGKK
jgi:serine---pyruvate transaminase